MLILATIAAAAITVMAVTAPEAALLALPLLVCAMLALLLYEVPLAMVALLVATYGLALDVQLDALADSGAAGAAGALGAAVVKVIPFAITAMLCLRYGFAQAVNLPFLAFAVIATISIVILPMGRVSTTAEMVRSFVGSTAPFVLAFAQAPRSFWSSVAKGAALVPVVSAVAGLMADLVGFYPAFDQNMRFQGMHSPPFLAGFCTTAIFAATLEYLRNWKLRWLVLGGVNLAILLATQARAPLIATFIFLLIVFIAARGQVFPLKRKVDLVMGSMLPGALLIGPLLVFAWDRLMGRGGYNSDFNMSGRDVIWPYFVDAIERRPLFGYGLGAGKLIVDPEDPQIRLIGSNAAHNEYLRLAVDAGIVGCLLIFLAIVVWIWIGTRSTPVQERVVLRAASVAVLIHSAFDNTLIASTAVMQFCWFAAALARGRIEARRPAHPGAQAHARARSAAAAAAMRARSLGPGGGERYAGPPYRPGGAGGR